jgi:hypothetical protein
VYGAEGRDGFEQRPPDPCRRRLDLLLHASICYSAPVGGCRRKERATGGRGREEEEGRPPTPGKRGHRRRCSLPRERGDVRQRDARTGMAVSHGWGSAPKRRRKVCPAYSYARWRRGWCARWEGRGLCSPEELPLLLRSASVAVEGGRAFPFGHGGSNDRE